MSYFNELPNIQYLSRFANQSSNEDYTLAKNIFRRAKLREDIASAVTAFQYYQIRDNERPDQIAERVYGDAELDWVILITNNITDYISQWPLSNNDFYEYLIDKYGSEDAFDDIKYYQTTEVKDEYDRLVLPPKLQVDPDINQQFTTTENGELTYDLNSFPIPSEYYSLQITVDLGEYIEVWERNNLTDGEEYKGEQYQITDIKLKAKESPTPLLFPKYSKLDYSNLFIYSRNDEIKNIFITNTLKGWPNSWGGILPIYTREDATLDVNIQSNIGVPIDITDDFRLYTISAAYDPETNTKKPQFRFISIGE